MGPCQKPYDCIPRMILKSPEMRAPVQGNLPQGSLALQPTQPGAAQPRALQPVSSMISVRGDAAASPTR